MSLLTPTIRPLPKQHLAWEKLLDAVTKYIFFGGGAGGGKTWLGCEWLLTQCYQYPKTKWFIGRKELKRLMASSYETWKKVCAYHNIPPEDWKLNGQYNYIEFKNGSRIDLLDVDFQPSDPLFERFGSTEYTGGWGEEAGEWVFTAFDVLKTRIGRHLNKEYNLHPKFLLTCNPKKNWLKRTIWNPFMSGTLEPMYAYIQSLYSDNHYTAESYGETLNEISDIVTKQRLRDGNWDYDEDQDTLVSYDALSDAFSNTIIKDSQKYLIIDVARMGKDTTTFNFWNGLELYRVEQYSKQDTQNTIQKAKDLTRVEQIPWSNVMIDEDGIGGAVVDGMLGVKGFIANSTPLPTRTAIKSKIKYLNDFVPKTNFKNLKTQCAFKLADLLTEHKISFAVPAYREVIIEELSALLRHKNADSDGKLQIKPKDEVKESLGKSPDCGDAIIYRMWFELKKDALDEESHNYGVIAREQEMRFERNKYNITNSSNK